MTYYLVYFFFFTFKLKLAVWKLECCPTYGYWTNALLIVGPNPGAEWWSFLCRDLHDLDPRCHLLAWSACDHTWMDPNQRPRGRASGPHRAQPGYFSWVRHYWKRKFSGDHRYKCICFFFFKLQGVFWKVRGAMATSKLWELLAWATSCLEEEHQNGKGKGEKRKLKDHFDRWHRRIQDRYHAEI